MQAHCQSRTSSNTRKNVVKELAKLTHGQKDNTAKKNDKITENKNGQLVTKAIRNACNILNMNIIVINIISSVLKICRFKIPHYA